LLASDAQALKQPGQVPPTGGVERATVVTSEILCRRLRPSP